MRWALILLVFCAACSSSPCHQTVSALTDVSDQLQQLNHHTATIADIAPRLATDVAKIHAAASRSHGHERASLNRIGDDVARIRVDMLTGADQTGDVHTFITDLQISGCK